MAAMDARAVARKREREKRMVSQMIALYCRGNHGGGRRRAVPSGNAGHRAVLPVDSSCGLCPACAELDAYARERSDRCPLMASKTFCSNCRVHCYRPEMRERIRSVMRYAGPRMLLRHPIAAARHAIETRREQQRLEKES